MRQRGFTLAEMIVSLALAGLLVSLVYGALRIGIRSWEAATTSAEQLDALRVGWQTVEHTLSHAIWVPARNDNEPGIPFEGTAERLSFAAEMPSHLGLGGLYHVTLYGESSGQGKHLILQRSLDADQPSKTKPQRAQLADNVEQIHFAYYGLDPVSDTWAWQTTWQDRDRLPLLVRLDVAWQGERHWPTLVARLNQAVQLTPGQITDPIPDLIQEQAL